MVDNPEQVDRVVPLAPQWPEFGFIPEDDGSKTEVRLATLEKDLPRELWGAVVVDDPRHGEKRPWRQLLF